MQKRSCRSLVLLVEAGLILVEAGLLAAQVLLGKRLQSKLWGRVAAPADV